MPNFDIVKSSEISSTFRNQSIVDTYELNIKKVDEKFVGNIDIENKEWNVGLITGRSGTGKTTIAKKCFDDCYFTEHKYDGESIVDNMPKEKSLIEITKVFTSVGFGTVWSWLKPYHVLSNGEKMRVDLARCILENQNQIVFDEFTSVVDRVVAKTASFAIQKAVRKMDKQFIAVSCHKDVTEWLQPDWVYDTDSNEFFFAQTNTKDQPLTSQLKNVQQKNGKFLKNITI